MWFRALLKRLSHLSHSAWKDLSENEAYEDGH